MHETVSVWIRLLPVEAVQPGGMIDVEVGELSLAVYNIGGKFYATQSVCTHAYAVLSDGWLDGCTVECPLHGGRFDVPSGRAIAHPAEEDLRTYEVRVVDGQVEALLPDEQ
jgi:nitrite reductase/ring-hydroxylating ferredoxin subunit